MTERNNQEMEHKAKALDEGYEEEETLDHIDEPEVAKRLKRSGARIAPYRITADESYMNAEQRAHFKEILLAWKRGLMEEADRTVTDMKGEANHFPDPTDRASQEEEFSLKLRARDRDRKLIKKIDEALQAIQADEYGYCEVCGVEIGIKRLEARPTATLCIDCKTLAEMKERKL